MPPEDPNAPEEEEWQPIPRKYRAYFYRIVTPVTSLLVAYGTIEEAKAALWAGLAGVILTGGLAVANTSTK